MSNHSQTASKPRAVPSTAPKISLNLSNNSNPGNPHKITIPKPPKRSHATALQDDDDDDDTSGHTQRVSHFDRAAGGAIDTSRPQTTHSALVIPQPAGGRDWRAAANARKRQKSGLPSRHDQEGDADAAQKEAEAGGKKPVFGLTVRASRSTGEEGDDGDGGAEVKVDEEEREEGKGEREDGVRREAGAKTDDERAIDALLGRNSTDRTLVVPQMTEAEAFAHDFRDAPDMATLDDYERVPVDQYGAAMLRGMGWKDGDGIGLEQGGKKTGKHVKGTVPERRAALLGIGAKNEAAITADMGAWGKNARGGKEVKIYNPVMLKDKRTGKMFTEDELQKEKEREEREKYEAEFDRKERDRERTQGRGENGHRRRDDDRRDGRERERRRRGDESDGEYHRRKEEDRQRHRGRDDRDSDYDRERSRRHRERDDGGGDEQDRERSRRHRTRDEHERRRDHDRHRDRDRRR